MQLTNIIVANRLYSYTVRNFCKKWCLLALRTPVINLNVEI